MNYYNDNDPFVAAWLGKLIEAGELPNGSVDARSIVEVVPGDLGSFRQCHFFAGIGGWPYALRLAGFPKEREIWTASLPCQPLSVAGARQGALDGRHLWPAFCRLVEVCRPPVIVGEQVASADGREWFAGVRADLEATGYACGAAVMPACAVGAPHRRERLYWCAVADADVERRQQVAGSSFGDEEADGRARRDVRQPDSHHVATGDGESRDGVADTEGFRWGGRADDEDGGRGQRASGHRGAGGLEHAAKSRLQRGAWQDGANNGRLPGEFASRCGGSFWDNAEWRIGADGKARRVGAGIRLLADGVQNRVGALRGFGNAIVPQVAAQFIRALM